jgi:hypothetical protein
MINNKKIKLKDLKSKIGISNNPKKYSAPYQAISNALSSYYANETRYSIPGSIPAYECCNPLPVREILMETSAYPINVPGISIMCNSIQVAYSYLNNPVNNIGELVYSLNHHPEYSQYGTYVSAGGGIVKLNMPEALAISLCPSGTITASIVED